MTCNILIPIDEIIILGYAWARLMKSKKAEESLEKFREILSNIEQYPLYVLADKGLINLKRIF